MKHFLCLIAAGATVVQPRSQIRLPIGRHRLIIPVGFRQHPLQ